MFGEMPLPAGPVPGNSLFSGTLDQREPVAGRIVLRRRARVRRDDGRQVQRLARRRLHLRRIDQAVAAHPDVVVGLRQVGQQVAAAIVGDDDLDELASAGRVVSAITQTPASGPFGPVTTPPRSSASMRTAGAPLAGVCRARIAAIDDATNRAQTLATSPACTAFMGVLLLPTCIAREASVALRRYI